MAEKSLLSIKGEVSWLAGDYSNVINSTRRMMSGMNSAITNEMRAGQRAREALIGDALKKIEQQEQSASDRLLKSKQQSAERISAIRVKQRTVPKTKTAGEGDAEFKKRVKGIKDLARAGEDAHNRLKKIQAEAGVEVSKTATWSAEEFAGKDAGQREAQIARMRENSARMEEERARKQQKYDQMKVDGIKRSTKAGRDLKAEIDDLDRSMEDNNDTIKTAIKLTNNWTGFEKEHREEMRKMSDTKKKLFRLDKDIYSKQVQMERDLRDLHREAAEEIGRVRQEMGEGLRNAFTFATVAVTAFFYKMTPLVETFKEFEAELVNAQSIWQNSQQELNELSDAVVQFGQNFGIEMGKATEGLYQYASAGVEAAEAMQMLNHTLTLAMAVQGDHNTLAKLTTQTIMGFNMEFSEAGEVTDKFAHAINKSLIEWDDLASSIKFALPFFISTGQSLDQLLGSLEILTNRALEAGIAGRGLRQALAEFTQHADDNSAAFHKLGVEILDVDGNMRELTDIAGQFHTLMGEGVNDMDIMMTLMEDLNIRGATAFVHLVQNAEDFQKAVDDLENSAGSAASMAEIQQRSLANQIQLVKNAMQAPFLMSDKIGEAAGYTNEFAMILHKMVGEFEKLIVVEKDGTKQMTEFGQFIKDFAIATMGELLNIMMLVRDLFIEWGKKAEGTTNLLHLLTVPITILLKLLKHLGPEFITSVMLFKTLSKIMPMNIMQFHQMYIARMADIGAMKMQISSMIMSSEVLKQNQKELLVAELNTKKLTGAVWGQVAAQMAMKIGMFAIIWAVQKWGKDSMWLSMVIGGLIGMLSALAIVATMASTAVGSLFALDTYYSGGLTVAGKVMAAGIAIGAMMGGVTMQMTKAPPAPEYPKYEDIPEFAMGGRIMPMRRYANGGRVRGGTHFPVMVEAGETIIPKTQNMLGGGGVTVNVGDVYAQDGTDFAQKLADELPKALRIASYRGTF